MTNIDLEKEMVFVKLIRMGPHILEFSDDYLMVHNGRITLATPSVIEKYLLISTAEDMELRCRFIRATAELIDNEYFCNNNLEWYSLRDYIANFDVERLEELKEKISHTVHSNTGCIRDGQAG